MLAEIDDLACERLLNNRSALALKLLAALNQGLVAALRSADRHLMRLNAERDGQWQVDAAEADLAPEPLVEGAPAER